MRLQVMEAADDKPNTFWREVVLSTAAPLTHQFAAPQTMQRHTSETMELSIDSKLESAAHVGRVMQSVTAKVGFEEDDRSWIDLAVHEAVINAIKHGNNFSPDKQVDIQLLLEQDALSIIVRDRGTGFDPTHIHSPLDPENLLNASGRGIHWMRTFMEEVEYSAHPDGGCVVRMKKYRR